MNREELQKAIERAINRSSGENESNTPDFILAAFLMDCFDAFTRCSRERERWFGHSLSICGDGVCDVPQNQAEAPVSPVETRRDDD